MSHRDILWVEIYVRILKATLKISFHSLSFLVLVTYMTSSNPSNHCEDAESPDSSESPDCGQNEGGFYFYSNQ